MNQAEKIIAGFVHSDWLSVVVTAIIILILTAFCSRITKRFMCKLLHTNEEKNILSSSIFVNISRGAVWILGICIMLSTCFNVDVSAAVTALGIGGIAVSLGFQDTISNLIGGLQVSLMRIACPGDNIEVASSSGVVKDVSWRHTTIRNAEGAEVIIPNSIISKTALVHLPPVNQVMIPLVVTGDGKHLNEAARTIECAAEEALFGIVELQGQPKLTFSAIDNAGFQGTLAFWVADAQLGACARDMVVRAIAPFTRTGASDNAADALKEVPGAV